MAVIRAKRLWLAQALPGRTAKAGEKRLSLYQVPPGKRAIVRSLTLLATEIPAVTPEPYAYIELHEAATAANVIVVWCWYKDSTAFYWDGQLVLHQGDVVTLVNGTDRWIHSQGSGHELPELG